MSRQKQRARVIGPGFVVLILGVVALACPIIVGPSTVDATNPFNRNGGLLKVNESSRKATASFGTSSFCAGAHYLGLPQPPGEFIIWAVAAPNGVTGVFTGSKAAGSYKHSYEYDVTCGPCPPGTAVGLELVGKAEYLQYVASSRGTGSTASSTCKGTVTVDPFSKSPFDVSANPAKVTAQANIFWPTTAGDKNPKTIDFADSELKVCPLNDQKIVVDLYVEAKRSSGIMTATASYNKLELGLTSLCLCPFTEEEEMEVEDDGGNGGVVPVTPNPLLQLHFAGAAYRVPCAYAEAMLADGQGSLILAESTSHATPTEFMASGPRKVLRSFDGSTLASVVPDDLALVGDCVLGTASSGAFSTGNVVLIESVRWNASDAQLFGDAPDLTILEPNGNLMSLPLSATVAVGSALAFGQGGPVFGSDLIAAQAEQGSLVRIDANGTVTPVVLTQGEGSLGAPADIAFAPAGSDFPSKLFVADMGTERHDSGALKNSVGRILTVDPSTGDVAVWKGGLTAPVAVFFGDGSAFGHAGLTLFVLSQGTIDADTGIVDSGTGTLTAYTSGGVGTLIASGLDVPYDAAFRTPGRIAIGTAEELVELGL